MTTQPVPWPYPIEFDRTERIDVDVLVIGGGAAGCFAAIGAAERGASVVLLEKASTISSGASGAGCDHWEAAATNPCSRVTPEELVDAMIRAHDGFNNGISHYIECREGYDRLLDIEAAGGKIRDSADEFVGADFRDDATKLLFAYDYQNRFTLRIWGATFKRTLLKACMDRKIRIIDRTMAVGLLTEGGRLGARVVGAVGVNGRTGRFVVVRAKAVVVCTSRPARLWLFVPGAPGMSEFRPPQSTGDAHAMGWRAGVAFSMLEKAIQAEWSGSRSFPPYGAGGTEALPQGRRRAGFPRVRIPGPRHPADRGTAEARLQAAVLCRPDPHAGNGAARHLGRDDRQRGQDEDADPERVHPRGLRSRAPRPAELRRWMEIRVVPAAGASVLWPAGRDDE